MNASTYQTLAYHGHWLQIRTEGNTTAVLIQRPDYTFFQHVFRDIDTAKRAVRNSKA